MPHFYGIAMYRFKDYGAAGLPVLPVRRGMTTTKYYILAYSAAFTAAAACLTIFGYTGYVYLVVMVGLGLTWLYRGVRGFFAQDDEAWGRQMFLFSLIVLLVFSAITAVGALLP